MQKILDRQGPDLADRDSTVQEIAEARQGLDRHLERLERLHDPADRRRSGARDRDQDGVRPLLRDDAGEIGAGTEHLDAVDTLAHLGNVVVHEADGFVLIERIVSHVAHDHLAAVARTVDENALVAGGPRLLAVETSAHPQPAEHEDQQDTVDEEDRSRVAD